MARSKKNSGLGVWIAIAVIVAVIAVGVLYYIGWFDTNTHVDAPRVGDNVEEVYPSDSPGADTPGESTWENADGKSLQEVIVED